MGTCSGLALAQRRTLARHGQGAMMRRIAVFIKRMPALVAIGIIMFYRMAISPLLPPACRFVPTCSEYGLTAFRRYGFRKGFVLTAKRILKCRPGGPHGYDPVP